MPGVFLVPGKDSAGHRSSLCGWESGQDGGYGASEKLLEVAKTGGWACFFRALLSRARGRAHGI